MRTRFFAVCVEVMEPSGIPFDLIRANNSRPLAGCLTGTPPFWVFSTSGAEAELFDQITRTLNS